MNKVNRGNLVMVSAARKTFIANFAVQQSKKALKTYYRVVLFAGAGVNI